MGRKRIYRNRSEQAAAWARKQHAKGLCATHGKPLMEGSKWACARCWRNYRKRYEARQRSVWEKLMMQPDGFWMSRRDVKDLMGAMGDEVFRRVE